MNAPLDRPMHRPIRVVVFGGPYLEPCALEFAVLLDEHPQIELAGVYCQASGSGLRFRLSELWQRRGLLAAAVVARELLSAAARFLRAPISATAFRTRSRSVLERITTVPNVHAPEVLDQVRSLKPDLGLIYGSPVLKPGLFEIPPLGTLGIHHGRVPEYRGKKTTFWEVYNGEPAAGVTIQRVNATLDGGDVVRSGTVEVGAKSFSRVERETQRLGLQLYLDAVLAMRDGCATFQPQPPAARGRHYRQPGAADVARLWLRIARRRLGGRA
jgi:methionyl-tRNA formyltransferase